jgi:hypothetical protein
MVKVYLMAPYEAYHQVRDAAERFRAAGVEVVSHWHDKPYRPYGAATDELLEKEAQTDEREMQDATHGVAFQIYESKASRGGWHTEFGYMMGQRKSMCVIGSRRNVYHFSSGVTSVPHVEDAIDWVRNEQTALGLIEMENRPNLEATQALGVPGNKPVCEDKQENVLEEANRLVNGERGQHYGPPIEDGTRVAGMLNALGYRGPDGRELQPHDWAIFLMAVKMSRIVVTPTKRDHWVDIPGYAQCGWNCVSSEAKEGATNG